ALSRKNIHFITRLKMKVPGNASALKPVFSGVQLKSSHSPSPVLTGHVSGGGSGRSPQHRRDVKPGKRLHLMQAFFF
ncbi:hypothetical protein KU617_22880, partial [Salmonella enterica subsp. enterica serovar Montevideo]|nr:hypothetical protein [Salmonella enterica subsp. enterica serovar Montevideo]